MIISDRHFEPETAADSQSRSSLIGHPDFSVVVKRRGAPAKPWRWEIYRAGRNSAIECSGVFFATMTEASRAGKTALGLLLSEHFG
jgi:hypothetical protein